MERLRFNFKQKRWLFLILGVLGVAVIVVATLFSGLIPSATRAATPNAVAKSSAPTRTPSSLKPASSGPCQSLGTLVDSVAIMFGSEQYGTLDLYYNSSTGYNCAYTRSAGLNYGQAKFMKVTLTVCTATSPGDVCLQMSGSDYYAEDSSHSYKYYAGPVGVNGRGHCIMADGFVGVNSSDYADASTHPVASHCG